MIKGIQHLCNSIGFMKVFNQLINRSFEVLFKNEIISETYFKCRRSEWTLFSWQSDREKKGEEDPISFSLNKENLEEYFDFQNERFFFTVSKFNRINLFLLFCKKSEWKRMNQEQFALIWIAWNSILFFIHFRWALTIREIFVNVFFQFNYHSLQLSFSITY